MDRIYYWGNQIINWLLNIWNKFLDVVNVIGWPAVAAIVVGAFLSLLATEVGKDLSNNLRSAARTPKQKGWDIISATFALLIFFPILLIIVQAFIPWNPSVTLDDAFNTALVAGGIMGIQSLFVAFGQSFTSNGAGHAKNTFWLILKVILFAFFMALGFAAQVYNLLF
jgi:hypothetical protein